MFGTNTWRRTGLSLVVALAAVAARADVTLPQLVSDHMVLQRGKPVRVWGSAAPGERVRVSIDGKSARATAGKDGAWVATLPPLDAGGPFDLTVQGRNTRTVKDVLIGEVWVCSGQSNMEWPLAAAFGARREIARSADDGLRMFTVTKATSDRPETEVAGGAWQPASPATSGGFSAVGYYFGQALRSALNVPVGIIHTSWGGTRIEAWTSRPVLEAAGTPASEFLNFAAGARPAGPVRGNPNAASALYNAMLAPLANATVTGAIWYQGESNAGAPMKYRQQLPALIADWRKTFRNPNLYFFSSQLAPFVADGNEKTSYAEIREAESMSGERDPKRVGAAVITDVGEERDIHPKKKGPVGQRLALLAEELVYGLEIEGHSPKFREARFGADGVRVRFDHTAGGLQVGSGMINERAVSGDRILGFQIAGQDGVFYPGDAKLIDGATVLVRSSSVKQPKAVRYGFVNFPVVNLFGGTGLPVEPFRSDRP